MFADDCFEIFVLPFSWNLLQKHKINLLNSVTLQDANSRQYEFDRQQKTKKDNLERKEKISAFKKMENH